MGLNAKDIQVHLLKMFRASAKSSYMFLQNHPLFSSVLLVFLILYIFLSYIYTFLVYMSPFLLCGAIFLRIFWSSEQTQLKYVKIQEKKEEQNKVEPKCEPKLPPSNMRHEILYKYPSQNATSRRKNFRDKKWDVYGGLEEKAKDLSEVFQNEYTKRNIEPFKKGESSLYYGLPGRKTQAHKRQSLRTEPSIVDLVECNDTEMEIEKMEDDEDEEDGKEDGNNAILWTENDQKNLMDLGNSEMERNRRLESLIARRRARKLLKLQVENGLIDKKSTTPSLMAPLVITRGNCDNDDLEMPGSAPSVMPRSPYDIPYEPFEEKPNLTNDGFLQEFTSGHHKNLSSQIKQEHHKDSFHGRKFSDRHAYSRFRRLPEKGNHDWLIDQLIYRENGIKEPKGDEEDEKCKTDIDDMKNEKLKTSHHDTKSLSESESSSIVSNISNVKTNKSVSQKPRPGPRFSKPHERLLNIPIPSTNITTNTINESMYDNVPSPIDKRQETMFLTDRRFCHTPTYSIASDLQVEVSEIGSLTSTVDENGESNNSPSDRDSVLYDGDIDRDVSSGSEDLWGASFHGRVITEEDNNINNEEEVNNTSKDIVSPISLRQIDEEDVADVSSYSSRDEGPEDTPTCCVVTTDHNIFGTYMKYSLGKFEMPQSSNSSYMTTPQNQLSNETHQANQHTKQINRSGATCQRI
uniref:Uncharacterized protein LOC101515121 n=1 Tax=Cicer arietinum TaxID=3827 RepID=A0A3Q7YB20_CICAR|nr:uncharacterized protein LOC101515121 [Cicer arietinum]